MIYKFSDGYRLSGDPEIVGRELERIRKKTGLTADSVLAEASNRKHSLHGYFKWDDRVAAHEYRLNQARYLIRAIVRIEEPDSLPVRAFVTISNEEQYVPVMEVLSDKDRRKRLFMDVHKDIEHMKLKLSGYEDLVDLIEMLDMVEAAMSEKIEE